MNINYSQAILGVMSEALENYPELTFGELLHHIQRDKFTKGKHSRDITNEDWYNILEVAKNDESLEKEPYIKVLNEEGIKSLGWKYDKDEPSILAFVKGPWDLWYDEVTKELEIESEETGSIFKGVISSLEDFKKVLKQNNIK